MLAYTFTVSALAALMVASNAQYVLQDDYSPDKFFDMFDFFTAPDPTHGFVKYVDEGTAASMNLINSSSSSIYMGVDSQNQTPGGRPSVRITSKASYTRGLIILDLSHMPGGQCGSWPAFWTVGPNWPTTGEIDIIEGVNSQSANSMALHTTPGCSIGGGSTGGSGHSSSSSQAGLGFSGTIATPNCDINAAGQPSNAGCKIDSADSSSYGKGFNAVGGGVYATQWTSQHISIWFFPRSSIPSDIASGSPNPSGWGTPQASFSGGCQIDSFFKNNQIVFDTTFCGDWAGNVWSSDPVCGKRAPTCQDFVRDNPQEYVDAFWEVNSLRVYQQSGDDTGSPAPQPSQGPGGATQSVPVPGAPAPSGPAHSQGAPAPAPSNDYGNDHTRGGGGDWNGRTWDAGDFGAAAVVATDVPDETVKTIPTATVDLVNDNASPTDVTVDPAGFAASTPATPPAAPAPTTSASPPAPASPDVSNDGKKPDCPEGKPGLGAKTKRDASERDLLEIPDGPVQSPSDHKRAILQDALKRRHVSVHRHAHRHLFKPGGEFGSWEER